MAEKIPEKFINRFLGMWSSRAADEIPDGYAANSRNCDHSDPASLQPVGGYSIFGTEKTDTGQKILSLFKYVKKDGTSKVKLRVRDDGSYSYLEWLNTVDVTNSNDGEWETLLGGTNLTTGKRMSFWEIPTVNQDQLAMGNGSQNFMVWKGGFGSILSNTATVITLNETTALACGFLAAGGTVIINGTEYSYAGISGATLTGLSGLPTFDANTGVAEAVDDSTYTTQPKTNVGVVAMSRLWLASGIRLYYSKIADGTNFTDAVNADDSGFHDVMGGEGAITALAQADKWIFAFKKDFIEQYRVSVNTAASGTTQYKYPERNTVGKGDNIGPTQQQALTYIDRVPYYVTAGGNIKKLIGVGSDIYNIEDITEIIRPTISEGSFDVACIKYFDNKKVMLASYKSDADNAGNDKTIAIYIKRDETNLTSNAISILDWGANDFMIDDNKCYLASAYDANVYKCFDGWALVDAPYTTIYSFKRYHFGMPFHNKKLIGDYLPIEGMISAGRIIKFELDYDEGGSRQHAEATLAYTDTGYIIEQAVNTIGAFVLGTEPIGGTLAGTDELSFFRVFFTLSKTTFYNIQLTVSSESLGGGWKITKVGMDAEICEYAVPKSSKKAFQL